MEPKTKDYDLSGVCHRVIVRMYRTSVFSRALASREETSSATVDENNQELRQYLPRSLCWAITVHECSGQMVKEEDIDLETSEGTTGLTSICFSRAKCVDRLVELMPFDSLPKAQTRGRGVPRSPGDFVTKWTTTNEEGSF